jgi:uncharacterized protein
MMARLTGWALGLAALPAVYLSAQTAPSFDCAKASGEIEQLICKDAELAALDRKMTAAYDKALRRWPAEEMPTQRATQRGWTRGRNDCWKADDKKACTVSAYRTRTVEIQITSGQLMAPSPVGYLCKGRERTPLTAAFYDNTEPPSAVLTFAADQVIAFVAPSGSGARYTAANVEFWEHQGSAAVNWFGAELKCDRR